MPWWRSLAPPHETIAPPARRPAVWGLLVLALITHPAAAAQALDPNEVFETVFLDTFDVSQNTTNLNFEKAARQSGPASPLDCPKTVVNGPTQTMILSLYLLYSGPRWFAPRWTAVRLPCP